MVVNVRPLKRLKRRVTADLCDFLTFPTASDAFTGNRDGSFRSTIQSFLLKHAQPLPPSPLFSHVIQNMLTWQIALRIGETDGQDGIPPLVTLDIVEEDVTRSRSVYCDQCRVVGWSGHPVCTKRYHFIIRSESTCSLSGFNHACPGCSDMLQLPDDTRCKSCHYEVTMDDLEEWVYLQVESPTHLLHGVVHSNGYGHLLRINGREGGSRYLSGCDIMSFWDRLCSALAVRKVTVMDVSKKHGMEYRLLHAVTSGHPWYGDWGYQFGAGSFALTAEAYRHAINTISNTPISFFFHFRTPRNQLQQVISLYWSLSDRQIETLRDLFCFVTGLLHKVHLKHHSSGLVEKSGCSGGSGNGGLVLCSWSNDDVERVQCAMMKVLQATDPTRWISWSALRGATCRSGSPELLDFSLKNLPGKITCDGRQCVNMRIVSETNAAEYRLNDVDDTTCVSSLVPSEDHLLRDLRFLYDSLLRPETMHKYKPKFVWELAQNSSARLLDCKHFVKDYEFQKLAVPNPLLIRLLCDVELVNHPKDYTAPPPELLVLPTNATVGELKLEAAKAFQEAYVVFKRFQVEQLLDYGDVDDSTNVSFLVGMKGSVRVKGRCMGSHHGLQRFRMERGLENWTVECKCGAKDDDGERMVACDACEIWQHTRCIGISDFDVVPVNYVCQRCGGGSFPPNNPCDIPEVVDNIEKNTQMLPGGRHLLHSSGRCNDQVVIGLGASFGENNLLYGGCGVCL